MGSRTPEQRKKHYAEYQSRPDVMKKRAKMNAARRKLMKEGVVKKGDGKDVDHIKPLRHGGGNGRKNLRAISRSKNRGWEDGR
jgi:5-methylcytosine-specific restriction endonuclease McrA